MLPDTSDPAPAAAADNNGTVYLIHFDTPYNHARHYTGWTSNLPERLEAHRHGRGARLMEVITDAGISWHVARTWPGDRTRERAIKNRHAAPQLCPDCTPHPLPVTRGRAAARPAATPQPTARPAQPRPDPYQAGAERGRRFLAEHQQLGRTAGQIQAIHDYVTGPWREQPRHTGRAEAEMRGYTDTITAGLARMRGQRQPEAEAEAGQ
jgi:predicted GIY-YIG superfamily endonuclease